MRHWKPSKSPPRYTYYYAPVKMTPAAPLDVVQRREASNRRAVLFQMVKWPERAIAASIQARLQRCVVW